MDNLLGQISSKLSTKPKTSLIIVTNEPTKVQAPFSIPLARSSKASPSPKQDFAGSPTTEDEAAQPCDCEDSESYAKRTITEIETCLGFTFHGAPAEEAAADTISNNELETLNTQVEAALQSGLNFKDRFTTNSRRRLALMAAAANGSDAQQQGADGEGKDGRGAAQGEEPQQEHQSRQQGPGPQQHDQQHGQQQHVVAPAQQPQGQQPQGQQPQGQQPQGQQPQGQQPQGQQLQGQQPQGQQPQGQQPQGQQQQLKQRQPPPSLGGKPPGRPGPPLAGGLKLAIGSQMETGEWKTNGVWVKKDKAADEAAPSNLQVIPADDLVKVRELGRGCFGSVWLAKWRGVEVALKELLNPGGTDTNTVQVFQEAEKLASLRHPCVMGFYGIVTDKGCCGTVAEYICHGSLRGGLQKVKKKGISDKRLRAYIALQAAYGMEYLHLHFMVHFDLKCDNLLCDLRDLNKPVVKIGDLGLSKTKKGSFISGNMRGTLPWMAPELFPSVPGAASAVGKEAEDRVTEKVDVFSYGIVLWEIWTLGEQPYPNLSLQEIFAGVMTGTLRPAVPPGCDPAWMSLMQDCWHAVPRLRPSFTDVVARLESLMQRWSPPQPGSGGGGSGGATAAAAAAGMQNATAAAAVQGGHGPPARRVEWHRNDLVCVWAGGAREVGWCEGGGAGSRSRQPQGPFGLWGAVRVRARGVGGFRLGRARL